MLFGGAGNDVLIGRAGYDVLDGGAGDDRLYGNDGDIWVGDDKFVFADGDGHDTICDFVAGAQTDDAIDLSNHSGANGFGDIAATQVGANTLIDLGADSITLLGVNAGDLHADDFIF